AGVGQGLAALLVSSAGDLLAGLTLGAITHTLEDLPGLLVLVPAAIGMRGNIFGALGSRLGTAIHTGEFSLTRRRDTVVGQNILASLTLTLSISFALAVLATVVAAAALVAALRAGRKSLPVMHRILIESLPVLVIAGTIDVVAGLTIEKRLESFLRFPALLILIPPFLEDTGALGSILSSRLASKLHLGVIEADRLPSRVARRDFALIFAFAVPVFVLVALSAQVASLVFTRASPGV